MYAAGVKDTGRPVEREDLFQSHRVRHVNEPRLDIQVRIIPPELQVDEVERRFCLVDEDELGRRVERDLARELGSDRAGGPRDQNCLAFQIRRQRRELELDRISTEKVFETDFPQLVDIGITFDNLANPGEQLEADVEALANLNDAAKLRGPRAGDGD